MKIRTIFWGVLIVLWVTSTGYAAVWQVDNTTTHDADFTSIQDANDSESVLDGDTLYVSGSVASYGYIYLTKQLQLIGPGYFLDENQGQQANILPAKFSSISFKEGAAGASVSGLSGGHIYIYVSNITIKRNQFYGISTAANNISNVIIHNNYSVYNSENIKINSSNCANFIISNNIIVHNYSSRTAILMGSTSSASIYNNTMIGGNFIIHNSTFTNNIVDNSVYGGNLFLYSSTVRNNLGTSDQFGTDNGNQSNVDMETVFVDSGTSDGQYLLATDSPAKGAGTNGFDCGAFGGATPYVLSGIHSIPTIYSVEAPNTGDNSGLPVIIKVKAGN